MQFLHTRTHNTHQQTLFCFSPPVMLATMIIEFGTAIYLCWRYRLTRKTRLTVAGLICLGVFQLAEYLICEATGIDGLSWARIGHIAISLLPPIGISLAMELAHKRQRIFETIIYCLCAGFIGFYGFWSGAISSETCQGNYVIFRGDYPYAGPIYALYYFSLLAIGVGLSFHYGRQAPAPLKKALYGLAIGYLTFIVPTTIVYLLDQTLVNAIPSIMCGFAVFLAIMIAGFTVPYGDYPCQQWALNQSAKKSATT